MLNLNKIDLILLSIKSAFAGKGRRSNLGKA